MDALDHKATLAHELEERARMAQGVDYETAHSEYANPIEEKGRRNPRILDELIQGELAKYSNSVSGNESPVGGYDYQQPESNHMAARKPIAKRDIMEPDEEDVEQMPDAIIESPKLIKKRKPAPTPVLASRYYLGHKLPDSELGVSL